MPNSITRLQERIKEHFPHINADIESYPKREDGFWILDVKCEEKIWLVLQGKNAVPEVGVSDLSPPREVILGEGCDELLVDEEAAYAWVVAKLT